MTQKDEVEMTANLPICGKEVMAYWVKTYDGEGGVSLATLEQTPQGPFTLDEARAYIRKKLGGHDFGCFDAPFTDDEEEEGLLECWHESENEGCGGYAIYKDAEDAL